MTRSSNTVNALRKLMRTSRVATAPRPLIMAALIWLSSTGCVTRKVIRSDETITRVPAGQTFVAPLDGWFMSDALYRRYRQAVADGILKEQNK